MIEPLLNKEDLRVWGQFQRSVDMWTMNDGYKRRVDVAKLRVLKTIQEHNNGLEAAWSGGKDSTAMIALISEVCKDNDITPIPAMSVKDDLDFPGEEKYISDIANRLSIPLTIIRPSFSLLEWIRDHSDDMLPGADIHGRSAELSKRGFYSLIEKRRIDKNVHAVFLGLRKEESHHRLMNRAVRGWKYIKTNGQTVSQPICDWKGLDVYAYLKTHDIDLLPMYRCIRLHKEPWRVRKSWWLPGASANRGQTVWLKTFYPSLYNKLCQVLPHHEVMT